MNGFREVRNCLALKSEEVIHSHNNMLNEDENSVKKNEESIFGIFMEVNRELENLLIKHL